METFNVRENLNLGRRDFFGAAAVTIAAAQLGVIGPATAQAGEFETARYQAGNAYLVRALEADRCGAAECRIRRSRPRRRPAVMLLHGWPYDIYSFVDVAPLLAPAGYRVIVPYLRGYGTTRFLSGDTMRNGQQSVVALDARRLDGCAQDREGNCRRL